MVNRKCPLEWDIAVEKDHHSGQKSMHPRLLAASVAIESQTTVSAMHATHQRPIAKDTKTLRNY